MRMRGVSDAEDAVYRRTARRVEYASIAWTSLESVAGIALAFAAGSVALLGFGVDSVIEVASSAILLWRLNGITGESRERSAHRFVGFGFLALGIFIGAQSARALITHAPPRPTYFGIVYAAACVIVMPLLARAKRRAADVINSDALHADSHQSDICAYLSMILLAGLLLNAAFGWWWADPLAALCMVPIILREAIAGLRGQPCCHDHLL